MSDCKLISCLRRRIFIFVSGSWAILNWGPSGRFATTDVIQISTTRVRCTQCRSSRIVAIPQNASVVTDLLAAGQFNLPTPATAFSFLLWSIAFLCCVIAALQFKFSL